VNIAGGLELPLPRMVHVRQKFATPRIDDVAGAVAAQFQRPEVRAKVKPGMTIAVGCGSRGIANIDKCVKQVITDLKALGARPFIFPAMGSHGGATAEGTFCFCAHRPIRTFATPPTASTTALAHRWTTPQRCFCKFVC
jgi:hypothetical protein